MKVIIVGGSISGLTLAHGLTKAGIDFEVLDAYPIAPPIGASIGLFQNGAIALEQIGVYQSLIKQVSPLLRTFIRDADGRMINGGDDPAILEKEFGGYGTMMLTRQAVIQTLYDTLDDTAKAKVHAGKGHKVLHVEQSDKGVKVHTEDGSVYEGDIVAGGDGIHSTIRSEMWRYKHAAHPETKKDDDNTFSSEYRCIFGIADPVHGLPLGESNASMSKPVSFLTFIGLNGEVFFFLYQKMPQKHAFPSPRFTAADAEALASAHLDRKITDVVTFGDIWRNKRNATLLAMDEGVVRDWTHGRFVLLGDAAHKMTVNLGQGGNSAIEDAAGLSNALNRLNKEHGSDGGDGLTTANIEAALQSYQAVRKPRVLEVATAAAMQCRVQDMETIQHRMMVLMMRFLQYPFLRIGGEMFAKATLFDFLPPPRGFDMSTVLKRLGEFPAVSKPFKATLNFVGIAAAVACLGALRSKLPLDLLSKSLLTQIS